MYKLKLVIYMQGQRKQIFFWGGGGGGVRLLLNLYTTVCLIVWRWEILIRTLACKACQPRGSGGMPTPGNFRTFYALTLNLVAFSKNNKL